MLFRSKVRLAQVNRDLLRQIDEKFGFEGVVGSSPRMHELIAKLRHIAPTNATVLVQGETGTGKELVAKALGATDVETILAEFTLAGVAPGMDFLKDAKAKSLEAAMSAARKRAA